jgi:hypothetical protein
MIGQMYVQAIEPAEVTQPFPIIMLHGMAQTGNNYLYTLMGDRAGPSPCASRIWGPVVDQVGCARSGSSTEIYGDYTHPLPESTHQAFIPRRRLVSVRPRPHPVAR